MRGNADLVRVVEVEPQTLWTKGTAPGARSRDSRRELGELARLPQHRLTHGIGYPIGGTICDQWRHVELFRYRTEQLGAPWTSEHLSILEVAGAGGPLPCGFLMPPLQTEAQVALAAHNIRRRAEVIGRPFAFETGVNYFAPRAGEMEDGAFFAAVAEAADCGIVLDLNNLWVNARNGRAPVERVLERLPMKRVWEVHLAGAQFAHDHWLDAHSGAIDPELALLAADVVAELPNLGAIIFEIAPDRVAKFGAAALLREMATLHRLWEKVPAAVPAPGPTTPIVATPARHAMTGQASTAALAGVTPAAWERLIASRMLPTDHRPPGPGAPLAPADERSFALYWRLAAAFRHGTIAELLGNTIRLLLLALGEAALRELLDHYAACVPPSAFPSDEALAFRRFLSASEVAVPGLDDVLRLEAAAVEAAADSRTVRITLAREPGGLLDAIQAGRVPLPAPDGPPVILDIGVDPAPFVRLVEAPQGAGVTTLA